MTMKTRKPWSNFEEDVSEFCSEGVRKMFWEYGVDVEDDDMLEFSLVAEGLIEITHLGSGETVAITDRKPGQPSLDGGRRVW